MYIELFIEENLLSFSSNESFVSRIPFLFLNELEGYFIRFIHIVLCCMRNRDERARLIGCVNKWGREGLRGVGGEK